ncbi:bile acid:sodium symporter family protein [[Limnothrix rosea] IAM M-220]|uniref:bile acid:sodium symporter family protein n=1 Tax=[Limnothrix rosea] IAM M-220 TaxID=454133 RepID=UPI001CED9124|nr:hypothetical protein [[Limnothrix rosea] IAM M-220]
METVLQIAVIILFPISIGMALKVYQPKFAATCEKAVKWLCLLFLTLMIVGILVRERANVTVFFLQVGWVTLSLNVVMMALGYGLAIAATLAHTRAKSITLQVGIQHGTLAIAIASTPTLLDSQTMAIPAAIYALIMFITSAAFWGLNQRMSETSTPSG